MANFGWSYPPGCSGSPYDDPELCEVCGKPTMDCICPECYVCGEIGNPDCYLPMHELIKPLGSRYPRSSIYTWYERYGCGMQKTSLQIHSRNQAEIDYVMADWYEYTSGAWIG